MASLKIQHIFFDLDRTLWDFETNSRQTLAHLYDKHQLDKIGFDSFDDFHRIYKEKNEICWELYRQNRLTKERMRNKRFKMALETVGHSGNTLPKHLGNDYVEMSPKQTILMDGSREILEYLQEKYRLHIITNGFEEIQGIKLKACRIDHYFEHIITSERAGFKKPQEGIFRYACKLSKASPFESVMIGDDFEIDARGAERFGMKGIHYNPLNPNPQLPGEINHLLQLKDLL